MPHNSPTTTPPSSPWSWGPKDDIFIPETYSPRPSVSGQSTLGDGIVTLAIHGEHESPSTGGLNRPPVSGGSTPEIKRRIDNASPETTRYMALRMYDSLKKHGLKDEAVKAFTKEEREIFEEEIMKQKDGVNGEGNYTCHGERKKSEELLGMEYLLRDGFVSYLRDVVKITPPIPQQVIRFSGIKCSKMYEMPYNAYETFGSKAVGCIIGPFRRLLQKNNSIELEILKGIDGYIMPGSITLLLGPPGSGKSTLLEVLAGRAGETKNLTLQGTVMYNNKHVSEVQQSRLITYISGQLNKHIPFLTVKETLEFARDCTQGLRPENFTPEMRKFFAHALVEGQDPFLEYILEVLSLKTTENKLAGGSLSDIDRQKLTIAELALGTYSVILYDQPLSGSDLAATFNLVDTMRTVSRIQQSSAVMSLTQLSEEVYDLFDRVILLCDGHIVFQGSRKDAVPYFTSLGYKKPSHVECHEFLENIVTGNGYQYRELDAIPLSLDELVESYKASDYHKDIMRIVSGETVKHVYWVESEPGLGLSLKPTSNAGSSADSKPRTKIELVVAKTSNRIDDTAGIVSTGRVQVGDVVTAVSVKNEEMKYIAVGPRKTCNDSASGAYSALKKAGGPIRIQVERNNSKEEEFQHQWEQFQRPFVQTWWKSTKTLISRQIKITKRLGVLLKLRLLQAIVLGLFAGTLFYKLGGQYDQQKMNSVRALGFVSTMSIMIINLVQLPVYMLQRPIFYKHQAQRFFRASSYVVAHCIVNLPQTFAEAVGYALSVYFLSWLTLGEKGAPIFQYLLLLFLVAYFGSSVFFFLSSITSIPEVANAMAGLLVSIFLLFSGFVIYPSNVPSYWKWLIYGNPIHWANTLFCGLQFENYKQPCSKYLGKLPYCDQYPSKTVGEAYLLFYELHQDATRPWLAYAILLAATIVANLLALWGLKSFELTGTSQSLPHLSKTPEVSHFKEDIDSEDHSLGSSGHHSHSKGHRVIRSETFLSTSGKVNDVSSFERWIEEFRVDFEKSEVGIPIDPVILLFENLSFKRFDEEIKGHKSVFSEVTGYARPHKMLAVLGGSATSKVMLLKCLAGRTPIGANLQGNLQARSMKPGANFFRLTGYVEKLDAHQPYLSVRESLHFSAALRLSKEIDMTRRHIHVDLVLHQLGLLPYADQLVGSLRDATGKTFEIAKKITIAVELAANPSILFLEEPIYGLDTIGTLTILGILSNLSDSGLSVIVTLSYPNIRSLSFFDQALILTREGNQAYFGETGENCNELLNYFSSVSRTPRYFTREGPISYIMGALGQGITSRVSPSLDFGEIYRASSLYKLTTDEIGAIMKLERNCMSMHHSASYAAPYSRQACLVLLRTQRLLWRNVQYTYSRLMGCIMLGLLMGSLYFKIEYKDIYGVTSRSLYIYMQVILIGVISANNIIPQIGTDRVVYFRERRAVMYHPIFYPVSWAVGEIPYFFIATLALVGIGNGLAGIGTSSVANFFLYWLLLFMFTLCMTYFGMMVTFLAPVPIIAAFLVSIVTSLWVSASGVVVVLSDIKFYKWMYWSNPFQYAMNSMTTISFYCDTTGCMSNCSCPQLPDGSYVWDRLAEVRGLSHSRIEQDMLTLSAMCLAFASIAFVSFLVLRHNLANGM